MLALSLPAGGRAQVQGSVPRLARLPGAAQNDSLELHLFQCAFMMCLWMRLAMA